MRNLHCDAYKTPLHIKVIGVDGQRRAATAGDLVNSTAQLLWNCRDLNQNLHKCFLPTVWLGFWGHEFKGQGNGQHVSKMHFSGESIGLLVDGSPPKNT